MQIPEAFKEKNARLLSDEDYEKLMASYNGTVNKRYPDQYSEVYPGGDGPEHAL